MTDGSGESDDTDSGNSAAPDRGEAEQASPSPLPAETAESITDWLARILKEDDEETTAAPKEEGSRAGECEAAAEKVQPLGAPDIPPDDVLSAGSAPGGTSPPALEAPAELLGVAEELTVTWEAPLVGIPDEPAAEPETALPSVPVQVAAESEPPPEELEPAAGGKGDAPVLDLPRAEQVRAGRKQELLDLEIASIPETDPGTISPVKPVPKPVKTVPGAALRSLEQALSRSSTGRIPPGLEKRAVLAVRFLFSINGVERAAVVVEDETGVLRALAVGGMEREVDLERTIPRGILRSTLSSGNSMLLVDAGKDANFSRAEVVKAQGIRSVLCVPFSDTISRTRGLLYADSLSSASVFAVAQQRKVEEFARRLATDDSLGEEEVLEPPRPQELTVETEPANPWLTVGAAVLVFLLALPSLTRSEEPRRSPTATPTLLNQENSDALTVLNSFIRALGSGNYRGAHTMLTDELREKLSPPEFEARMKAYLSRGDNAVQLSHAEITERSAPGETPRSFTLKPPRAGSSPWELEMERREGVWCVGRIAGGPSLP